MWSRNYVRPTLDALTYAFSNSRSAFGYAKGYKIPLERYQYMYGNNQLAKRLYDKASAWGGSCFAFSSSAGIFFDELSGFNVTDFRSGASRPYDLKVGDNSSKYNMTVRTMLECFQISQSCPLIASDYSRNGDNLDALVEEATRTNRAGPTMVCIWGKVNNSPAGHALLAYRLDQVNSTTDRLYIYDCNFPNKERYITLTKNSSGHYTKWYYKLNDKYDWGTGYSGNGISYVPYRDYAAVWSNRGKLGDLTRSLVTVNAGSAELIDYEGNVVATLTDGELNTDRDDIYQIIELGVTEEDEVYDGEISFWVPTDLYQIRSTEPEKRQLEITVTNLDQTAQISTEASQVTFAVDDEEKLNYVQIDEDGADYELRLTSSLNGEESEMYLTGTTTSQVMALGILGNDLYASGVDTSEDANIFINGVEVNSLGDEVGEQIPASAIRLSRKELFVELGHPTQLSAVVLPDTASSKTVTWTSSDPNIALVNESGMVAGIRPGEAQIVATVDGVCAICNITVGACPSLAFTDLPDYDNWAHAGIDWAVTHKITAGTSDTSFSPNQSCTRAQVVTFLWRAAGTP